MVKKSSSNVSKTTWSCPEGCLLTKYPCKHLEKLLPSHRIDPRLMFLQNMTGYHNDDAFSYHCTVNDGELNDLLLKLKKYPLEPFQVEVLIDKAVYKLSFREIMIKYSYINVPTVQRVYQSALNVLKKHLKSNGF